MIKPIGYISYTHGLDGKVKIVPMISNIDFEKVIQNNKIFLSNKMEVKISISAFNGKVFICKIDGYDNIDKVKSLLKKEIFVEVEEDTDYIDAEKLVGFNVFTTANKLYGKVVDCGDYGAGMLIEVELLQQKTIKKKKQNEFYICDKNNILSINYQDKSLVLIIRDN